MNTGDGTRFDVAVIGGGATGYAAAIAAAAAGLRTVLFAPPAAFPPGRTAALLQGSADFLAAIGVWDRVADRGAPITAIRLVDATRRLIRAPEVTFYASEVGLPAFGHNIANGELVAGMAAVAERSDRLEIRAETVAAIRPAERDVGISTEAGAVSAKRVVGADGARSLARRAAGIGTRTWSYPQAAVVATLATELPHGGTSTEFHTEHGPFTLVPMPRRRVSLVWVDRPERAAMAARLEAAAFAEEVEKRSASICGALRLDSEPAVVPLRGALADRLAQHRVMLVGEAAHVFPPIGAQGLNLGFRDADALRRILLAHRGDPGEPSALAAFDRARRLDVASRTLMVDILNRSLLTDFLPVQALRSLGMAAASGIPFARQFLMRQGLAARLPAAG